MLFRITYSQCLCFNCFTINNNILTSRHCFRRTVDGLRITTIIIMKERKEEEKKRNPSFAILQVDRWRFFTHLAQRASICIKLIGSPHWILLLVKVRQKNERTRKDESTSFKRVNFSLVFIRNIYPWGFFSSSFFFSFFLNYCQRINFFFFPFFFSTTGNRDFTWKRIHVCVQQKSQILYLLKF